MIICGVHGLEPAKDYCGVGDCLRLDIDIPVMQKQVQISESRIAKQFKRKKKKAGDVKYVGNGNVANGVNIPWPYRIGNQNNKQPIWNFRSR